MIVIPLPGKDARHVTVAALKALIDEVERDIKRTCEDLREIAKEIDKRLGL